MPKEIWEFCPNNNRGVLSEWKEELSVKEQAKLDASMHRLRAYDFELLSKSLLALVEQKVYKLRLRCANRELRPLLCRGPIGNLESGYTFLLGAYEKGDKWSPGNAVERAVTNRETLVNNPGWRKLYY